MMTPKTAEREATSERQLHQIGEVAEHVGLSLRTVRYYEEVGLLAPLTRTDGGFRLYTDEDIERLLLIKQMKPLGFSIEEMRGLLKARDALRSGAGARAQTAAREQLDRFAELASERCNELKKQLRSAESFAQQLRAEADSGD